MRVATRGRTVGVLTLAAAMFRPAGAWAVVPVPLPPPFLTPLAINVSAGDQTDPHVSGDWAAYGDTPAIRYYRFITFTDAAIPRGPSERAQPVTVWFVTWRGTALPLADFVPGIGRITIAPQQLQASVTVRVRGETVVEGDETFYVVLFAPQAAMIDDGIGQGTIVNDDP